jgi:integrase
VARNVCDAVRPPKVQAKEMRALSPEEARQLLTGAVGDPLEALYILAVTVGLRQGELLGLKWQDVDLDAGRLQVRRSIARVNGHGWLEQEPKSASSRRSVALTPLAVAALQRHRQRQLERRLKALAWEDNGFVFANEVGRPMTPQNLTKRSFHPLLERAGLPRMRFHDLRHTAATLLLAQGVHPKIVQEMLGHASISLTLDTYSHVTPSLQAEAAEKMQAIFSGR